MIIFININDFKCFECKNNDWKCDKIDNPDSDSDDNFYINELENKYFFQGDKHYFKKLINIDEYYPNNIFYKCLDCNLFYVSCFNCNLLDLIIIKILELLISIIL